MKRMTGFMMILFVAAGCASVSKTPPPAEVKVVVPDTKTLEERVAMIEQILIGSGHYPGSRVEKIDPTVVQRIEQLEKQMSILYNEVHRLQELRVVPVK